MCLLESESLNISEISIKTKINRPRIYKVLPHMLELWIVYKIVKWKVIYYKAGNPDFLRDMFNKTQNDFENMFDYMDQLYSFKKDKPSVQFFDSAEWQENIFKDIVKTLDPWDTFYRYSSRQPFDYEKMPWAHTYKVKRDEKQLERYVITSEKLQASKKKKLEKDVVIIPTEYDLFDDNISKFIYGSRIAVIDYNTNTSFIIENEVMAKFEKKLFMLLFKFLRKTQK